MNRNNIDLAFITETWLREGIADSVVSIPGYTIMHQDRATDSHSGVCLYTKNDHFKCQPLDDVKCCDNHEILWAHLKPTRLPRGFSGLVAATVYHPKQSTANNSLWEHLFDSLTLVEARDPNCALLICGDFNRFNTQTTSSWNRSLRCQQERMQLSTWLWRTCILTIVILEHFCFSVCLTTQQCWRLWGSDVKVPSLRNISSRDTIASLLSRKSELGQYLGGLDWSLLLSSVNTCHQLEGVFRERD